MADNMRWFKVWTTLLGDYFLEDISLEDVGRFTLLGCLMAKKGSKGKYEIESDALCKLLNFAKDDENFAKIPENFAKNFNVKIERNDNGSYSVSFKNWHKYQKDSTGYKRLVDWRKKQDDNAHDNGDKKKTKTKTKTKIKTKTKNKTKKSTKDSVCFKKPSLEEVQQYITEKGYNIDPELFIAHYESNGWKVGKNAMKSWKHSCVTWSKRDKNNKEGEWYE